jgi:hypothetical protein
MPTPSRTRSAVIFQVFGLLALVCMVSCRRSDTGGEVNGKTATTGQAVYVVLEGPWAIAPDPDSSNGGLLAIAPNLPDHGPFYVKANHGFIVLPGEYTFSISNAPSPGADQYKPLQATVSAQTLKAVQKTVGFKRYAIHLPKPDVRGESTNEPSRVDPTGQLPVSTGEVGYTAEVSFQYSLANLQSIGFKGASDPMALGIGGTPLSLPLDQAVTTGMPNVIRIGSEPSADDTDNCSTHSKEAFHTLVGLFGLKYTIDFPNYTQGCQACDPQAANPLPTCPSANVLLDMDAVQAFVRKTGPSKERDTTLREIEEIRSLILGKGERHEGRRQLFAKVADVDAYIISLKDSASRLEGYENAFAKAGDIYKIFSLPGKDCKSPALSLTVQ